ncbi:50S ribosomal protein L16 [Candidatus Uhrbacteria bacterium]|nr:50S ribosomal protein L16 [Candidatus Uhrbacteria bacterium]
MLIPRKVKHRKWHKGRGRTEHPATRNVTIAFGEIGLKATTGSWMTSRQIESARRVITRATRKGGKIWIRVFPDHPVTTKGNEVPMGMGKGGVDHYVAVVRPGMILFEIGGVDHLAARAVLREAAHKLPVRTVIVERS